MRTRVANTDAELLAACQRGETMAFGHLVERYQALVRAVSYGATGDRAMSEDVAQETFLAAWTQLTDLREPGKLRGWLCAIARNLGIKSLRRAGREVACGDESVEADVAPSPLEATLEAESAQLVWDSLRRIPETYREALVLFYQENQSVAEVGKALGISEEAALQRLSRGRRHLKDRVSSLIEQSLAQRKPRPEFAAMVVAGLPARFVPPPHVPASSPGPGAHPHRTEGEWNMLKIIAVAGALAAAAGGAVYVGTDSHSSEGPAPEMAIAAAAPSHVIPPEAPALRLPAAVAPDGIAAPGPVHVAPEPDSEPRVDGAALLAIETGPSRGPANAPVTVVLFTDFMCPYCEKVVATVDQLFEEYPGKLRLVMKQFPVHDQARLAAEAALAADAQGKFWELHDQMMVHQDDLSEAALNSYAESAGLEPIAFGAALSARTFRAAVEADQQQGKDIDIMGTPSFLINGRLFVGARPIEDFRAELEAELSR